MVHFVYLEYDVRKIILVIPYKTNVKITVLADILDGSRMWGRISDPI